MKTLLFALLFTACGDNTAPPPDAGHSFGWRSCSAPFVAGGPCVDVCCEFEDWSTRNLDDAGTLEGYCVHTLRVCTL